MMHGQKNIKLLQKTYTNYGEWIRPTYHIKKWSKQFSSKHSSIWSYSGHNCGTLWSYKV